MGLARRTNDVLYVAGGGSNNIVMFDTSGAFLGTLSHADLTGPQGIAFDDNGHFFSSSFYLNTVVEFDENNAYVRTITDGGLQVPRSIAFLPSDAPSSVDAGDLPASFALLQNYPNPFNPGTTISYRLASGSRVVLRVFDLLGQEVALLVNNTQPPGTYSIAWYPEGLASGVYLYRLDAGGGSTTRSMMLLR
jgi:hypothetical protein